MNLCRNTALLSFPVICSPFGHARSGIFFSSMFLLSEADHWRINFLFGRTSLFYNERFVLVLAVSWSCSFSFVLSILSINIHPPDTSIQRLYLSWGYYRNTVHLRLNIREVSHVVTITDTLEIASKFQNIYSQYLSHLSLKFLNCTCILEYSCQCVNTPQIVFHSLARFHGRQCKKTNIIKGEMMA